MLGAYCFSPADKTPTELKPIDFSNRNQERIPSTWTAQRLRRGFVSSCRGGTICHYRSLYVFIRAFKGAFQRAILPIRRHSPLSFSNLMFRASRFEVHDRQPIRQRSENTSDLRD